MSETDIQTETLRIVSFSSDFMVLRLVRTELNPIPEDWIFPEDRLPDEWLDWKPGKQFDLTISKHELEWLQGKRELDDD
jgi:hypothetical protein